MKQRTSGTMPTVRVVDVPRKPDDPPFSVGLFWGPVITGAESNRRSAWLQCPFGHRIDLENHSIDAVGNVLPEVACSAPGCGFHSIVRLLGWNPRG